MDAVIISRQCAHPSVVISVTSQRWSPLRGCCFLLRCRVVTVVAVVDVVVVVDGRCLCGHIITTAAQLPDKFTGRYHTRSNHREGTVCNNARLLDNSWSKW